MRKSVTFRFVIVTWLDHYSEDGWEAVQPDFHVESHPVCSCGWLLKETDDYIVLGNHLGKTLGKLGWDTGQRFTIVKSTILEIEEPFTVS